MRLIIGTGTIVEHNKPNGDTPCDSIHVNSKDINVNNLSVSLLKCSDTK